MVAQIGAKNHHGARLPKKKRQSEIVNYLKQVMNGFIIDPPTSDYQRGYLAAMKDTKDWINK